MTETTVVIGAGASADFNLPLGGELFDEALSILKNHDAEWKNIFKKLPYPTLDTILNYFGGTEPYTTLIDLCTNEAGRCSIDPIRELASIMERAPVYSLDTLALENPEQIEFCKFLTAYIIINNMEGNLGTRENPGDWNYLQRKLTSFRNSGSETSSSTDLNWIHLFTSMMRNTLQKSPNDKFHFISFNYDGIVEQVVKKLWQLSTRDMVPVEKAVTFCYPHGRLHWIDKSNQLMRVTIEGYSQNILFAHNKENKDGFSAAQDAINNSDTIIALGFHFSPENLSSLDFYNLAKGKSVIYQNYDSNDGLRNRVKNTPSLADIKEFNGPIPNAILQGKLGELPS
jgi:hypothetical protein